MTSPEMGSIYTYGDSYQISWTHHDDDGGDETVALCVQIDAEDVNETATDDERTQCLPPSLRGSTSGSVQVSSLNVGTHSIRMILARGVADGRLAVLDASDPIVFDIVPRRGGDIFRPVENGASAYNAEEAAICVSNRRSYDRVREMWSDMSSCVESSSHTIRQEGYAIGVLGLGDAFGGQEHLNMEQLRRLCPNDDVNVRQFRCTRGVYITPHSQGVRRREELIRRNISFAHFVSYEHWSSDMAEQLPAFYSAAELRVACESERIGMWCESAQRLVSMLRSLELDILVVPHHGVDTVVGLHIARLAGIHIRVLEMPNLFPLERDICEMVQVIVFPSCFAAHHENLRNCRDASRRRGGTIVSIPPVGLEKSELLTRVRRSSRNTSFVVARSARLDPETSNGIFVHVARAVRDLLRVIPQSQIDSIRFILLGAGTLESGLRRLVAELDLDADGSTTKRVTVDVRGGVSNREVHRVLAEEADAYLSPRFGETFGIGIVEAMAYGVTPLVCNLGGPGENIQHNVSGIAIECDGSSSVEQFARYVVALALSENNVVAPSSSLPRVNYQTLSDTSSRVALHNFDSESFVVQYGSMYELLTMR